MDENVKGWQWVAERSDEIQREKRVSEDVATGMAWEEWDRAKRVVTIRKEAMRKAKVAAKRQSEKIAAGKDKRFNPIKGLERLTG